MRAWILPLLFVGMLATQARGSAVALVIALVIWAIRQRRFRLSPLVFVGVALLVTMTYVTVSATFQSDERDNRFNSLNSRVETYDAALDLWRSDPLVGVGLKFWRNPSYATQIAFGEPHNLVVSALGESGLLGLGALALLVGGMLLVLSRVRGELGMLAFLLVLTHVVDSVVGIYWVAGTLTIGSLVLGLACLPEEPPVPSATRKLASTRGAVKTL